MRKSIVSFAGGSLLLFANLYLCAQDKINQNNKWDFNVGIRASVPVTTYFKETQSFGLGAELRESYNVSNNFALGGSVVYDHFFGKKYTQGNTEYRYDAFSWTSLNVTTQYRSNQGLLLGVDAGIAFLGYSGSSTTAFNLQGNAGYTWDCHAHRVGLVAFYDTYMKNGDHDDALGLKFMYDFRGGK